MKESKIFLCVLLVMVLFIIIGKNSENPVMAQDKNSVVKYEDSYNLFYNKNDIKLNSLIITGTGEESNEQEVKIKEIFSRLKVNETVLKKDEMLKTENIDFNKFDFILCIFDEFENSDIKAAEKIFQYIKNGGHVIWMCSGENCTSDFMYEVYKCFGINSVNGTARINGINFEKDLIPASKGRKFEENELFSHDVLNVKLDEEAEVYMTSSGNVSGIPLIWEKSFEKGRIVFLNGIDFFRNSLESIAAGCIGLCQENFLYPVINAKSVIIEENAENREETDINNIYSFFKTNNMIQDIIDTKQIYDVKYSIINSKEKILKSLEEVSTGFKKDDFNTFKYLNMLDFYGIFYHYIDKADFEKVEEQGKDYGLQNVWNSYYIQFCDILEDLEDNYKSIRNISLEEVRDVVEVYNKIDPIISYEGNKIKGCCNGFFGQAFFYLRTDKKPSSENNKCEIKNISDNFYLVTINSPSFEIKLL